MLASSFTRHRVLRKYRHTYFSLRADSGIQHSFPIVGPFATQQIRRSRDWVEHTVDCNARDLQRMNGRAASNRTEFRIRDEANRYPPS